MFFKQTDRSVLYESVNRISGLTTLIQGALGQLDKLRADINVLRGDLQVNHELTRTHIARLENLIRDVYDYPAEPEPKKRKARKT